MIQDPTKDLILRYTAIRWFTLAGIIAEEGKVADFVNSKIRSFLYNILIKGSCDDREKEHVDRIFYLMYKNISTNKMHDLQKVYKY